MEGPFPGIGHRDRVAEGSRTVQHGRAARWRGLKVQLLSHRYNFLCTTWIFCTSVPGPELRSDGSGI